MNDFRHVSLQWLCQWGSIKNKLLFFSYAVMICSSSESKKSYLISKWGYVYHYKK